jgi:hypothetical protein
MSIVELSTLTVTNVHFCRGKLLVIWYGVVPFLRYNLRVSVDVEPLINNPRSFIRLNIGTSDVPSRGLSMYTQILNAYLVASGLVRLLAAISAVLSFMSISLEMAVVPEMEVDIMYAITTISNVARRIIL